MFSCKQAALHYTGSIPIEEKQKASIHIKSDSINPSISSYFIDSIPLGFRDILTLDSSILIDIKYATDANFTKQSLYPCARCILKIEVAEKLNKVNQELKKKGYQLKLLDCYRPLSVQKKLWKANPDPHFVMSPSKGSGHSRGTAVDVCLVTLDGKELDMGSSYDEFSNRAYYSYPDIPDEVKRLRWILKSTMKTFGFNPIRTEWWHFQYGNRSKESVLDFVWKCKQ